MVSLALGNFAELWFPGLTKPTIHEFDCRVGAIHPESRGCVTLRSADPLAPPRIQFNLLTARADIDTMIRGVRMARDIYRQKPIADFIAREMFPGPGVTTDAGLEAAIRANASHRAHPVGTCAMGTGEDAVVDAELRVRGIEGLRVRRCLGDARDYRRQHQRSDHHDRGKGRRPDPRPRPAGGRIFLISSNG